MTRLSSKPQSGWQRQAIRIYHSEVRSLIHKHWDFLLSIGLGLTLFIEDRLLRDPTVTAFLILFGLTFLFSLLPQISNRMQRVSKPMQYALAGVSVSGVVLIVAPLVLAQAPPAPAPAPAGTQCGGGLFGPLAQFFSTALGAAGGGGDVCTLFGLIQAALVVVFVIAIGVAVYQVGQGAEFRSAFTPVALALVVVVAAGIIIRLFMGTGATTAAPTTGA